jgi:hypothetical protein
MNYVKKILAVYDWIRKCISFDDLYEGRTVEEEIYERKSWDYSLLFYEFMSVLDIPCVYCVGSYDNGSGVHIHRWNMIQLEDGKYYLMDATKGCVLKAPKNESSYSLPLITSVTLYYDSFSEYDYDHLTVYEYYDSGAIKKVTEPDGDIKEYDENGILRKWIDSDIVTSEYDENGILLREIDGWYGDVKEFYENGQWKKLTTDSSIFEYNEEGLLIRETSRIDGSYEENEYENGILKRRTCSNGSSMEYDEYGHLRRFLQNDGGIIEYDENRRVIRVFCKDITSGEWIDATFDEYGRYYDENGNLKMYLDENGKIEFEY